MNFFSKIIHSLNRSVGIDLGSSNVRIWVEGRGLIIDEPSLVAVDQINKKVVAVGKQAARMLGRVDDSIKVFSPILTPKFTDEELLKAMLKMFLAQVGDQVYFFSPTVVVSISDSFYPSMKDVLVKVLVEIGAGEVMLVDQTLAAVLGAGAPISDALGLFVLQMGEGVAETSAISLGKVVQSQSSFMAGSSLINEIIYWFTVNQKLAITRTLAKKVLTQIGSLMTDSKRSINITGLDVKSGEPLEKIVFSHELEAVFFEYGRVYVKLVKKLLANISPDLTVDVLDKGLLLSGGLANLYGIEDYLTKELRVPVSAVDEPELAAIQGVGVVIDHLDEFRQSIGYQSINNN